jgi:hypothetical protein
MPRVNNTRAIDYIARQEPFDNNSGSLQGRRSFAGWGKLPREHRLRVKGFDPDDLIAYWVYSDDTPILWVTKNGSVHMPPVRLDDLTSQHQGIAAVAMLQTRHFIGLNA